MCPGAFWAANSEHGSCFEAEIIDTSVDSIWSSHLDLLSTPVSYLLSSNSVRSCQAHSRPLDFDSKEIWSRVVKASAHWMCGRPSTIASNASDGSADRENGEFSEGSSRRYSPPG